MFIMKQKKILLTLTLSAMLVAGSAMPAFAASLPTCSVNGCNQTAAHTHYGTCYAGHYYGDGHDHSSYGSGHHGGHGSHSGGHHGGHGHC